MPHMTCLRPHHVTGLRARPAGFTLVELLVVIGIIALLVSILLPSLNAARRQADSLKCSTALREIGNAVSMYINEHRGYIPPARVLPSSFGAGYAPYELNGVLTGAATNITQNGQVIATTTGAYWPDFLVPYVARGKKFGTASVTDQEAADAQNSVLWGCTTFQKYVSNTVGGFNRIQNGYGYNPYPMFTAGNPALGVNFPAGTFDTADRPGTVGIVGSTTNWRTVTAGTWHKANRYTEPSRRVLVADGQFWLLEANAPPMTGEIPPQKLYNNSATYSTGVSGQTLFDFYRHGQYPKIAVPGSGGYYESRGGRVSYNILYVDGHVENTNDRAEAYRSLRMRFPG